MKIIQLLIFCSFFIACNKEKKVEITPINNKVIDTVKEVKEQPVIEEASNLVFTVQIAALKKPNEQLAGLANVYIYYEDSLLKYRFGAFKTYNEAKTLKLKLEDTYEGVFVQALLHEFPISITKALQYLFI